MDRYTTLLVALILTTTTTLAQNWTGAVDADWNNPANWSEWPLGGENITIDPSQYIGVQAAPEIASNAVFTPDRMFVANGATVTIQANLTVDDRLIISDDAQVTMSSGVLTTGRLIMETGGGFTLMDGTVNSLSVFAFGDDGVGPSSFTQFGGTVNAAGEFGFDCEVGVSDPRCLINGGSMTINGDVEWLGVAPSSGRGSIIVNSGTVQVNGDLLNSTSSTLETHVEVNGGSLTCNSTTIELAHATDSVVQHGGVLHLDNDLVFRNDGVVHTTNGDLFVDQQTELRGVGSYHFHHVHVGIGNTLQHTDPAMIMVSGDWDMQGDFDADVNTVAFVGNTTQTVIATDFFDLRLDNSGDGIVLSGNSSVAGTLALENGIIRTTTNDLLTVLDNASAGDGSNSSHVDGPMRKVGNDAFVFPVGKNGSWRRIGIDGATDPTSEYTAEFFEVGYVNTSALAPGLIAVNSTEHWTLERSVTTDEVNVELYWEDAAASSIPDCNAVVVAHWDGSAWNGNLSTTVGSCTGNDAGSVQSENTINTFMAFTFGTSDGTISVEEQVRTQALNVYPNPANAVLQITGIRATDPPMIFNAQGQRMQAQIGNGTIDVSAWPDGIYVLKSNLRDGTASRSFIVQH